MIGEIAALTTALCWAIAARMFRMLGKSFSPLALNFYKGLIAITLLWIITYFFVPSVVLSNSAYFWLLLSGIIGIGLGDTFFFQALNKIGDSQSILVAETLAPIFTALMAMAWINEWLSWQQWVGIAVVIFSVDVIVKIQKRDSTQVFVLSGYVFAGLAALCQAAGAVISRDVLTTYTELDAFNASQIRLIGGMLIVVPLMLFLRRSWKPKTDYIGKTWLAFVAATVLGAVTALYLQMLAFQHTKAAIVQTLFATSVVLSLGIALILGEKVSKKTALWSFTALVGVSVLVFAE